MSHDEVGFRNVRAFHIPSARLIDADDVNETTQEGPWACGSVACRVPLTFKPGFMRRRPVSGGQTPVRGHWVCAKQDEPHEVDCTSIQPGRVSELYDPVLQCIVRSTDVVLIQFGDRTPVGPKEPSDGSGGDPVTYAGRAGTLAKLLMIFVKVGGHEGMKKLFFRHDGFTFRWDDIAYGTTPHDYQRLMTTFLQLVNPSGTRPWIVGGVVTSITSAANNNRMEIRLRPDDDHHHRSTMIGLFYSPTEQMQACTRDLVRGTRVVVLLRKPRSASHYTGIMANLASPEDIVPLISQYL